MLYIGKLDAKERFRVCEFCEQKRDDASDSERRIVVAKLSEYAKHFSSRNEVRPPSVAACRRTVDGKKSSSCGHPCNFVNGCKRSLPNLPQEFTVSI